MTLPNRPVIQIIRRKDPGSQPPVEVRVNGEVRSDAHVYVWHVTGQLVVELGGRPTTTEQPRSAAYQSEVGPLLRAPEGLGDG